MSTGESKQVWVQESRWKNAVRCVSYLVVGVVTLLTALTIMTVADTFTGGPQAAATGTAQVRECTEMGPVSLAGLGYYYRCEADVSWNDGTTSRERFLPGQLSPDDRGEAVPVFSPNLPESGHRGGNLATDVGRNDSTKWLSVGVVGSMALGLVGSFAVFFGLVGAYFVVRPGHVAFGAIHPGHGIGRTLRRNTRRGMARRKQSNDDWPVTEADEAVVPRFRREVRVRLVSLLVLLGILLHLFASIPYNDAPRASDFVSPWPEIPQAWLWGPAAPDAVSDFGVALVGSGIAALIAAMSGVLRNSSAQVARYGTDFLMSGRKMSRKQVSAELGRMADGRQAAYRRGVVYAFVVLAVGVFAAVHAVIALPADAPLAVVIAGMRDAITVILLGGVLLATVEPKYDRIARLLEIHEERARSGAAHGTAASGTQS